VSRIRRIINWLIWIFLSLVSVCFILILLIIGLSSRDIPQVPDRLESLIEISPTKIFASDGSLLTQIGGREVVPFERMSKSFINAVLAAEDDGFYKHHGVDKPGLVKAIIGLLLGKRSRGGSTITQQLAKNLFFTFEKSVFRKFKEMLTSFEIERRFEKDEILSAYCNWNYFGGRANGVEAAASYYFGIHASELSLSQAALLAGIPNSPGRYNPYLHPEKAIARQRWILSRMEKLGYISNDEKKIAVADSLIFKPLYASADEGRYFLEAVLGSLEGKYGKDVVYHGGLKIYTTLDPVLQGYAIEAVRKSLEELDKRWELPDFDDVDVSERPNYFQGLLVSVENSTGAVKALVGGRDWFASQYNRAMQNNRNMGSTLKPALYLTAIEKLGYTSATVVIDTPVVIKIPGTRDWRPPNFDKDFIGRIVLKGALERSINTVAAQLIRDVGPEAMVNTLERFGIQSPMKPHYSIALGANPVSAVELAGMTASIANGGQVVYPFLVSRVEDSKGSILEERIVVQNRQFNPEEVYQVIDMMKGVVEYGTAKSIRNYGFELPAICKTGTTNDYRDSWFIGATPILTAVAWVGFDDNRPMRKRGAGYITGATGGLPVWARFMTRATVGDPSRDFDVPPGIEFRDVHLYTGQEMDESGEDIQKIAVPVGTVLPEPKTDEAEDEPDNELSNNLENLRVEGSH